MVLTGLIAGLSVTVLLVAHAHYLSGCVQGAVCRPFWQINAEDVPALRELGLSVGLYAAYGLAIEIVYLLGFWAIGAVIFWSRPNDRLALFFSLMLVSFGTVHATSVPVVMHPALDLLVTFFSFFVYLAFSAAFYVFPDGHFVPRWTRWVTIIWALYIAALYFLPEKPPFHPFTWPVPLSMGLVVGLFSSMVFAQIYRYQRVSGPVERQQTKWVVFGLTAAIAGVLIAALPSIVFEEEVDWTLAVRRRSRAHRLAVR
jgi:hypothetical protein